MKKTTLVLLVIVVVVILSAFIISNQNQKNDVAKKDAGPYRIETKHSQKSVLPAKKANSTLHFESLHVNARME